MAGFPPLDAERGFTAKTPERQNARTPEEQREIGVRSGRQGPRSNVESAALTTRQCARFDVSQKKLSPSGTPLPFCFLLFWRFWRFNSGSRDEPGTARPTSCDAGSRAPILSVRCRVGARRCWRRWAVIDCCSHIVSARAPRGVRDRARWIPPAIGGLGAVPAGVGVTKHRKPYKNKRLSKLITGTFEFCANSNTGPNLS
jgi:hypothetical protein